MWTENSILVDIFLEAPMKSEFLDILTYYPIHEHYTAKCNY